jgi:hypothetical protein
VKGSQGPGTAPDELRHAPQPNLFELGFGVRFRGKGNRLRTVTIPAAVKVRIDTWLAAAKIYEGKVFRPVNKGDRVTGKFILDEKAIWQLVE